MASHCIQSHCVTTGCHDTKPLSSHWTKRRHLRNICEIRGSFPAVSLPHTRTRHDKVSALLLGPNCSDLLAVLLDACVILLSGVRCTSRMIPILQNPNSKADIDNSWCFCESLLALTTFSTQHSLFRYWVALNKYTHCPEIVVQITLSLQNIYHIRKRCLGPPCSF